MITWLAMLLYLLTRVKFNYGLFNLPFYPELGETQDSFQQQTSPSLLICHNPADAYEFQLIFMHAMENCKYVIHCNDLIMG